MRKVIGKTDNEKIEGYCFTDKDGDEFYVDICGVTRFVELGVANRSLRVNMYKEDIPLLIKVLEAAYNHEESL